MPAQQSFFTSIPLARVRTTSKHVVISQSSYINSRQQNSYWIKSLGVSWPQTRNSNFPFSNTKVSPRQALIQLSYQVSLVREQVLTLRE